ncbi:MAG: triple tyrosine motif-containing protein [Armatimonadota bacterium]
MTMSIIQRLDNAPNVRRISHVLAALLFLFVCSTMVLAAPVCRPDLWIKGNALSGWVGVNTYNDLAAQTTGQTATQHAATTYLITIQNSGTDPDTFSITSTAEPTGWSTRYFDAATGGSEITAAVTGAGWSTAQLAVGESVVLRAEVTPDTRPVTGAVCFADVTAASQGDDTIFDEVRAATTMGSTGKLRWRVPAFSTSLLGTYNTIAYSPDSSRIAAIVGDTQVAIFTVSDGKLSRLLSGHQRAVTALLFSPDNTILYTVGNDGKIRSWRVSDGALLRTISVAAATSSFNFSGALSADGTLLAVGHDNLVSVYNTTTGNKAIADLTGFADVAPCVAFSPKGTSGILAASSANTVRLWQVNNWSEYSYLSFQPGNIARFITFTPDGMNCVIVDSGQQISTWRNYYTSYYYQLDPTCNYPVIQTLISSVAIAPNGGRVASCGLSTSGDTFALWNRTSGALVTPESLKLASSACAYSPDGQQLAVLRDDGAIHLLDSSLVNYPETATLRCVLDNQVNDATYAAVGDEIAVANSASGGGSLRFLNPNDGTLLRTVPTTGTIINLASSPDGSVFAGINKGIPESYLTFYSGYTDNVLGQASINNTWVFSTRQYLAFAYDDEHTLMFGNPSTAAAFYDYTSYGWAEFTTAINSFGPIRSVAVSPDDVYTAIAGEGGLKVYYRSNRVLRYTISNSPTVGVAYSPDGTTLAQLSSDTNNNVALWNAGTGGWLRASTISDSCYVCAFSPDSKILAVGGGTAIYLLRVSDGMLIDTFPTNRVTTLRFLPDGLKLMATDGASAIAVWNLIPYQPDMLIRAYGETSYIGAQVYSDGADQVKALNLTADTTATYQLAIRNNGLNSDQFALKGDAGGGGWTVQYFTAPTGGIDITTNMVAGDQTTGVLANGGTYTFYARVTPDGTVPLGARRVTTVTGTSINDATLYDVVTAKTTCLDPALTVRLSVHTDGTQGTGQSSFPYVYERGPSTSEDAQFTAFASEAGNLIDTDTNGKSDIFVRDWLTPSTVRVSIKSDGSEANEKSYSPAMSGDGSAVAFVSTATNLTPTAISGVANIFLHYRTGANADATKLVSVAKDGINDSDGPSSRPSISRTGHYVVFASEATNLVDNDTNNASDIFLRDTDGDITTRISVSSTGTQADGGSYDPYISADGRYVVYTSLASNLDTNSPDTNESYDIFVYDTITHTTTRVSVPNIGGESNDHSYAPVINADGSVVVYSSRATNLLGGTGSGFAHIYRYDRSVGVTTLVSAAIDGTPGNSDSGLYGAAVNGDGTVIAFSSSASNLVAGDTNGRDDIFVSDLNTGEVVRVSTANNGAQANGQSWYPSISSNGYFITYASLANNLVLNDTNDKWDVFLHERGVLYLPDLQIKASADPSYKGVSIYGTVEGQTADQSVRTGDLATYNLRIQNNSPLTDTFLIKGDATLEGPAADGWTITYLDNSNADITAAVTGAGWQTPVVQPGSSVLLKVTLRTFASLPTAAPKSIEITANSVTDTDGTKQDIVRALTTLSPYPTVRVSIDSAGLPGNGGSSDPGLSGDGRFVCFPSGATNLVLPAYGAVGQVFVHDRLTGLTELNSVSDGIWGAAGVKQADSIAQDPDISGDGRYLVFNSKSKDLVAGANDAGVQQIFLRDRQEHTTTIASLLPGEIVSTKDCSAAVMSEDGHYMSFISEGKVYRRDLTGVEGTIPVSLATDGTTLVGGCESAAISADGRFITFRTKGDTLIPGLPNTYWQIFIHDCDITTSTQLVSVSELGTIGAADSGYPTRAPITSDGRYVTFVTKADLTDGADTNGFNDIYVRDTVQNHTFRISLTNAQPPAEITGTDPKFGNPSISSNGKFVAFDTVAALVPADTNAKYDVYAYNLETGTVQLASLRYDNQVSTLGTGDGIADPFISKDGRYITFNGTVDGLVQTNSGSTGEIYIRDMWDIQPDLQISVQGGEYDTAAASKTILTGGSATYQLKLLTTTNSTPDEFIITGSTGGNGWSVQYFDALVGGNDITAEVTGAGWQTPVISSATPIEFLLVVTADPQLLGSTPKVVTVVASAKSSMAIQDRVAATTTPNAVMQPDTLIRNKQDYEFIGDNVYNNLGAQTKTQYLLNNQKATYYIKMQNDGNGDDTFLVSAPAGSVNWSVVYKNAQGVDITSLITTVPSTYSTAVLSPGASETISVEVIPNANVPALQQRVVDVSVTSSDLTHVDIVEAKTIVQLNYQPDLQIKLSTTATYIGIGVHSDGHDQIASSITVPNVAKTYNVRVKNDGNSNDSFTITSTGAGDPTGWTVEYFDNNGIPRPEIATTGWTTGVMPLTGSIIITVQVTPDGTVAPNTSYTVALNAVSTFDAAKTDVVKATTIVEKRQPDLLIRNLSDVLSIEDDLYNTDGTNQTKTQEVDSYLGEKATYIITLQNDGNVTDSFMVNCPAVGAEWGVKFFDAPTAGNDITEQVNSVVGGWFVYNLAAGDTKVFRVEVTPNRTRAGSSIQDLLVTAVSTSNPTLADAVKASTSVKVQYQTDMLIQSLGNDIYDPAAGAQQTYNQLAELTVAAVYSFQIQNDGNVDDTFILTAPTGDAGWTFEYFDDTDTAITDITTPGGWLTPTIAAGNSLTLTLKVTADATVPGGASKDVLVLAASSNLPASRDAVLATTTVKKRLPDLWIRNKGGAYVGDDQYTPTVQAKDQTTDCYTTAVYEITLQNDGNLVDSFRLTAPAGSNGWTVKCFDAFTGNNDITSQVTGAGWVVTDLPVGGTATLRIEVTPGPAALVGTPYAVNLTATSESAPIVTTDLVTANTTVLANSTNRLSVGTDGTQGIGESKYPSISRDGRYIAFESLATNLVPGVPANVRQIYVYDRQEHTLVVGSQSGAGTPANTNCFDPSISADGLLLAFRSTSNNLDGATNGYSQIFLRDLTDGTTTLISKTGATLAGGNCYAPVISTDGSTVAFHSDASNLTANDVNGKTDVFVRDSLGGIELVSVADGGGQTDGTSFAPSISSDGRYVAYWSGATNLVVGDANGRYDIFLRDRESATTEIVSVATGAWGSEGVAIGNGNSYAPSMSEDGRYIAYHSDSTNLVADDSNNKMDIFLRDRSLGITQRVSIPNDASLEANGISDNASISADGQLIAFSSVANNLVTNDTNSSRDIFVYTVQAGTVVRTSMSTNGSAQGNGESDASSLSPDGRFVAYHSLASNLVPNDTNNTWDVFVNDVGPVSLAAYRPDLLIRNAGESGFIGAGTYALSKETKQQSTVANVTARYEIALVNKGITDEPLLVTGGSGGSGWTVKYFDSLTGTNEITAAVTDTGWTSPSVAAGAAIYLRVEMTPANSVAIGTSTTKLLTAKSTHDASQLDTVQMITTRGTLTGVTLSASPIAQAPANTTVTLTALATGSPFIEYEFAKSTVPDVWEIIRPYDAANTYDWLPSATGSYTLRVQAREVGNATAKDAEATLAYLVGAAPITDLQLTADPPSPAVTKTPITLTATATGGQNIQYKFFVTFGGVTTTLRVYGTSNSCTWTPSAAGSYVITAWAREIGNTTEKDFSTTYAYTVLPPAVTRATLVASPSTSCLVNATVTLYATATGGLSPQYKFLVSDGTGWTVIREFANVSTCSWKPTNTGTYSLQVWVRSTGRDGYDASAIIATYTVNPGRLTGVTLSASPVSPQFVNTDITLTARAIGGSTPTYKFFVYTSTGWKPLQEYSTTATCPWKPALPGIYTLQVWAKNQGSANTYDVSTTIKYTVRALPPTSVSLAISPISPQLVGKILTLTATAVGGTNVQYRFFVSINGNPVTQIRAYSTSRTCSYVPYQQGNYTFTVWAKNTDSTNSMDVSASQIFVVSPKPLLSVRLTTDKRSPQPAGYGVMLTATPTGGGTVEYKFLISNGAGWTTLREYGTTRTCLWKTTIRGTYQLKVLGRNVGSTTEVVSPTITFVLR